MSAEDLKAFIRDIPDFPKPGILFKDITPLLGHAPAFRRAIDLLAQYYQGKKVEQVVCVESRGFILGAPLAYQLGAGVVMVRKPGKLPFRTHKTTFTLEYGTDSLEIHQDAILPGQRVLIIDDVLATGGTLSAVVDLVKKLQGHLVGIALLLELEFLQGRKKLEGQDVMALLKYK